MIPETTNIFLHMQILGNKGKVYLLHIGSILTNSQKQKVRLKSNYDPSEKFRAMFVNELVILLPGAL